MSRPTKTPAERSREYRARKLATGLVDFRRFVSAEIRAKVGKLVSQKVNARQRRQNSNGYTHS